MKNDLRQAWRSLRASPGFAAATVLALALGIGATAAIFSVVNGVLLRPLPYADPDRLVFIWEKAEKVQLPRMWLSVPNYRDWRERNRAFDGLAVFGEWEAGIVEGGDPEPVPASWNSANLFEVLGVRPALGRPFSAADDAVGAPRTVILGHGLWQRRFGADPDVLGRTIELDGDDYTVIGVMPDGFDFPRLLGRGAQLWVTVGPVVAADPELELRDNHSGLTVVARLRDGMTPEAARREMTRLAAELRAENPENFDDGVALVRMQDELVGGARRPLTVLMGAVVLLLAIACANVASLALARATGRTREVSLRAALGAGRARIVRQLLTESVLLALAGGVLGLVLATWGVAALLGVSPDSLPRAEGVRLDLRVVTFALVVSALTGIAAGLAPALEAARTPLNEALRESSSRTTAGRANRLRRTLVVGELALALVLLSGAALLVRSFQQVLAVDPGFDTRGVLTAAIALPQAAYPDVERQATFFRTTLERVRALPGVTSATVVTDPPLSGEGRQTGLRIQGIVEPPPGQLAPLTDVHYVGPDFFATMGIPLREGRGFTEADGPGAPFVAVIDEQIARRWFPGESPIGHRIGVYVDEAGETRWREIVGVAAPMKAYGVDEEARIRVYMPWFQEPDSYGAIAVRSRRDPAALAPEVREAIWQTDPRLPLGAVQDLGGLLAASLAPRKLTTLLLGAFAGTALLLACLGTYGLIAYGVTRRTREIGVRVALGASPRRVLVDVLAQGLAVVALALALGVAGSVALSRLLSGLLFEVSPRDPMTLAIVAALLATVAMLASWVPARRALRVDPAAALRHE